MQKQSDRNLEQMIELTREMLRLADKGDADREDTGCGIVYGTLRDSAYKLSRMAEEELKRHVKRAAQPATGAATTQLHHCSVCPFSGEMPIGRLLPREPAGARAVDDMHLNEKEEIEVASLKGSQTAQNLLASFAGESQARNRYTYFAGQARKDGFVQIADIFEETANQEKEHAKRFFKFLEGGDIQIVAAFPAGIIGPTVENLKAAADGEQHEHAVMYPGFSKIAREEGFDEIAAVWDAVSVAEKQHEKRYRELAANIDAGQVFKRGQPVVWRCRNCGYLHEGMESPQVCPACAHPQAHFELLGENW